MHTIGAIGTAGGIAGAPADTASEQARSLNPSGAAVSRALRSAAYEIRELRRQNEVLAAKVEVLNVFKAALMGPPQSVGMSPDVVWELERLAEALEPKSGVVGGSTG